MRKLLLLACWVLAAGAAQAQYPDRAVTVLSEIRPLVESNRLHPIGAFQVGRSQSFPDLPTRAEAGYRSTAGTMFTLIGLLKD